MANRNKQLKAQGDGHSTPSLLTTTEVTAFRAGYILPKFWEETQDIPLRHTLGNLCSQWRDGPEGTNLIRQFNKSQVRVSSGAIYHFLSSLKVWGPTLPLQHRYGAGSQFPRLGNLLINIFM